MFSPQFRIVRAGRDDSRVVATSTIRSGSEIARELPLVAVPAGSYRHDVLSWDFVDLLLSDGKALSTFYEWNLKVTSFDQIFGAQDVATEKALSKKHRQPRPVVRRLFYAVCTNNIGYFDSSMNVAGHGLYKQLSRLNHSCEPSAELQPGDAPTELRLVASKDISPDEEITWNYFEKDFLAADYHTRNYNLVSCFRFVCACPRCAQERPTMGSDDRALMQHFDARALARASLDPLGDQ